MREAVFLGASLENKVSFFLITMVPDSAKIFHFAELSANGVREWVDMSPGKLLAARSFFIRAHFQVKNKSTAKKQLLKKVTSINLSADSSDSQGILLSILSFA
jgi:hypothetical protein